MVYMMNSEENIFNKYILDIIKKRSELIINFDQTPSSYVSVDNNGCKTFTVCCNPGLTDKRNITLTVIVTLSGEFLPLQIIYGGKTKVSLI